MKLFNKIFKEKIEDRNQQKKRINIFVTKEQYSQLENLRYKYRLSISYLVRIITLHVDTNPILKKYVLQYENLYNTTTMKKTSIKIPRTEGDNKPRFYNNAVIMYLEKLHKNILDEKQYKKFNNQVANAFEITTDPLWNYNEYYRMRYLARKFDD